ncbi:hypothetical protein [Streptomyces yanii]|uniref:Uncharacterized protein n=1 Tax=Streptomyces yanii TaxID=78510 RepID=A0ABV5R6Q7_9ACTN
MRSTRRNKVLTAAAAVVATGLLAGVVATTTGTSTSGTAARGMDAVEYVAAGQNSATFRGTFRKADGCPYLVSSGGTHYYLPGYTIGGNGALYKKGGGFIAYPGWKIQANGTKQYKPLGNRTTHCTSWGDTHRIKARSIYALQH